MQVFGDEDGERSEDHPDHETDIEIEECSDKRGQVPGAQKSAVHGRRLSVSALVCAARLLVWERTAVGPPICLGGSHRPL